MEPDVERDLHTLLTAARNDDDALEALKVLRGIRDRLDTTERALIESARNSGASWATIATALGLTSRQAAEQRHLRLGGNGGQNRDVAPARAARHRQRTVDTHHGPAIARLRTATRTLLRRVEADEAWPNRFTRAALAKDTLTMAVDATPGALYALATSVIDDLRQATETELPQPIAKAAEDLQKALT